MPRRIADAALVVTFVVALAAYSATSLGNVLSDRDGLAKALDRRHFWKSAPRRIEECFRNHAAGHAAMVRGYARLKWEWFGGSSNPKVWFGRDGWLYFNHSAEDGFVAPHDPAMQERLDCWAKTIELRREWLANRGIKYLVVVAPDKQTIYPEFLPRIARRRGPQPLDGLIERCKCDSQFQILDLRPQLRASRSFGPIYRLTDSHWTANGTYAGYAATTQAIGRWYEKVFPDSRTEFVVAVEPSSGGDLARLLGLGSAMFDVVQTIKRKGPAEARDSQESITYRPEPLLAHVRPRAWTNERPGLPRVVLLGDSFADDTFCELLAEHCSRLVRVGSYHGQEALIEREKPDIVICQFVERMLEGYSPRGPR